MPKKPVKKTAKTPTKTVTKTKKAPQATGMWKILEMKKAKQKSNEQARSEGRNHTHGQGQAFQSHPRDPRFTKFAGPRRKAG